MKELTRLMQELEDQLLVCMRCGMCQAVCPVFEQTGRESDVARGKLALLDGLMQEMFKDPEGVYQRLNKCLLCGSCAANCPSGVDVLEIFMRARAILTGYMGLPSAKKAVLRGMLSHPEIFDRLVEWGAKFQKLFTRPVNDVIGTSCARFVSPLLAGRHFMPLASVPFHRSASFLNTNADAGLNTNADAGSSLKVAFFIGCLIDKIFPRIAKASIEVLHHHGVAVFIPDAQGCCGIPAVSAGDTKTFERLLLYNLEKFEAQEFDYLVTACATCTSTLKKVWPFMVGKNSVDIKARVKTISEKTMDINQFLVTEVGLKPHAVAKGDNRATVTYHDPCHLKKSLGVAAEPRALIRANPRFRLNEMSGADSCCGMGGSFNLQFYDISTNIGKLKRDNIKDTGCSTVATGCPACMLQISDMLSKSAESIAIKHSIEIYAESLKNR